MGGMNTSSQQLAVSGQELTVVNRSASDSAYGIILGMKQIVNGARNIDLSTTVEMTGQGLQLSGSQIKFGMTEGKIGMVSL